MKRRLNILCVLIALILGYSVYEMGYSFAVGIRMGAEMAGKKENFVKAMNIKAISLMPEAGNTVKDSVLNEVSGTYVPAIYGQLGVVVPVKVSPWIRFFEMLLPFICIVAVIIALTKFFKLIVSINRSDIFTWKNVSRLRWLGSTMILLYACMLIPFLLTGYQLEGVFKITGYELFQSELVSIMTLVLGVLAFIVGEVFAIGLKLKEEQELTI